MAKILFILGEHCSGKSTLETYLCNNYGFSILYTDIQLSNTSIEEKFVVCITPSGYHQFIDMGIEDQHEVESIFLTCDIAEEWMRKRGDSEADITRRLILNKKLRKHAGGHEIMEGSRGLDCLIELLKLIYPTFLGAKRDSKHNS